MSDVFSWYVNFLEQLQAKVEREVAAHDPTLLETVEAVGHCLELCRHGQEKVREGLRWKRTIGIVTCYVIGEGGGWGH